MAEKTVEVKQVRSSIARPKDQLATLRALGLGKIGRTASVRVDASMLGMLKKVSHLISVKEQ